jgi:hypothetical protein
MEDEPSPLNDAKLVAAVDKSMKLILEERSSYTSRLIRRIKSIFKKGKEA